MPIIMYMGMSKQESRLAAKVTRPTVTESFPRPERAWLVRMISQVEERDGCEIDVRGTLQRVESAW